VCIYNFNKSILTYSLSLYSVCFPAFGKESISKKEAGGRRLLMWKNRDYKEQGKESNLKINPEHNAT
jgi:hypothetical protein